MIRTQAAGRVRVLTLDRPDRRNALTLDGLEALREAVADASEPVVYLHGAGPAFCAGADLSVVESLDVAGAATLARAGQRTMNRIESSDAVVVAGIDGPARGGGVELALAADLRIATPAATFAEPGVSMGIFGAWGGTRRLPAAVGETQALDLSLSGRTIDASEAKNMGLVSRVVEDPRRVAEAVARNDPAALTALKRLLRERAAHRTQEDREVEAFRGLFSESS
ncbi:MAG: enoyl-CoA hydratase/isomerase family protein [Halodesulfurarchaeum sp.]